MCEQARLVFAEFAGCGQSWVRQTGACRSGTEPLATNSLQGLPNRKLLPFQIEIYPAQPERFAFPKSEAKRNAVKCLEPFAFGRFKKFSRLFEIERFDLGAPNLRGINELGDVAADKTHFTPF